jgi:8-oxo-dGTP pyrophosphatase MutT (NUDIX family)
MATPPATPRLSASVILVRDGPTGLEAFMVRRHAQSPVAPSAYVFPGGTVRADDVRAAADELQPGLAEVLAARSDSPLDVAAAGAVYVSAVRELFEEAGVLLARQASGALVEVNAADQLLQERLATTRLALQAHELSLANVFTDWGWRPAFDLLVPFSHWVTPTLLAARFDTRFFVAAMPPGQAALHDTIELSEGVWLTPEAALDNAYHTVYATAQHLRRLQPYGSVAELLSFARTKAIVRVQPEVVESKAGRTILIDPAVRDRW